nr:histidine kinase [uncultured Carboxylicivirga sp.]
MIQIEKQKKLFQILASIFIWTVLISIPLLGFPENYWDHNNWSKILIKHAVINLSIIVIFYLNFYLGIPRYFYKRKYWRYLLFIIITIIASFIPSVIVCRKLDPTFATSMVLTFLVFTSFLVIAASFAIYYFSHYQYLMEEKTKSELLALKHQINPHFLFNTLNVIYGQAIKKSETTANSIAKLSTMMRYVISDANQNLVQLEKELDYIKSYIDFQKLRLTNKTTVNYSIEGDVHGIRIPSLILVNFIENAFKYGVSNEVETTIDIKVELKHDVLQLIVTNNTPHKSDKFEESSKIGMDNTLQRLKLLYGDDFNLLIKNEENLFEVKLKILLDD